MSIDLTSTETNFKLAMKDQSKVSQKALNFLISDEEDKIQFQIILGPLNKIVKKDC